MNSRQRTRNTIDNTDDTIDTIKYDENDTNHNLNRILSVGTSFCGKTYLLTNKLQLYRLENPEQQITKTTRSLDQYLTNLLDDLSVEENPADRTLQIIKIVV